MNNKLYDCVLLILHMFNAVYKMEGITAYSVHGIFLRHNV